MLHIYIYLSIFHEAYIYIYISCVVRLYVLQRVAVCCSALQCVAGRCILHIYIHLSIFHEVLIYICISCVVRLFVLQCVAVCCSVLQCAAVCCSVLQRVAVCCSVLQCAAVCCSVLQCVAVCCSVFTAIRKWIKDPIKRNQTHNKFVQQDYLEIAERYDLYWLVVDSQYEQNPKISRSCFLTPLAISGSIFSMFYELQIYTCVYILNMYIHKCLFVFICCTSMYINHVLYVYVFVSCVVRLDKYGPLVTLRTSVMNVPILHCV